MSDILGIDIGGSGIKAAPVSTITGELLAKKLRVPTPKPPTPDAVLDVIEQLVEHFSWQGPVGAGFPGVVKAGTVKTAVNLDKGWVDLDADALITKRLGVDAHVINDADAAGLAEVRFGAGRDIKGVVMMVTLGTGIGTALFSDGVLLPNTELGHLVMDGQEAEQRAAARIREELDLSWKEWGHRVQAYLAELERLVWPDLIVIGGGVSDEFDQFEPYLAGLKAQIVPAAMENRAGIVGAALASHEATRSAG